ncbi:MAG TPA: potassium-transporting ATPase subunit KdpC [Gammaproteobacteria bacterium]|nr:potassium-transporting ATPase subunit KdpC [Gammaproteobacteria bacterium]
MMRELRTAAIVFGLLTVLTGVVYPGVVTAVGRVLFPKAASGSIIERNGNAVGSSLLGQSFTSPGYFWGRPSATAPQAYNGAASGGSNLGPTNPALEAAVRGRIAALRAAAPDNADAVPIDLVTASGSGLDPHISPAAAEYQLARVARARGLDEAKVRELVREATEGRTFGVLGEPRVDVLRLNLALDELARKNVAGEKGSLTDQ